MRQLGQAETLTARFDVIVASHPSSMITAENVRPSAVEIDRIARTLGLEVSVAAPARQAAEDPRWDVERTIVTLDGPSLAAVGRLVHALRDLDQPLHCESVEVSALQPSPASGTVPWHYRLTLTRLVPAA
ncbi:MAG TPA: hypothetical protein DCQ98_21530 [Planctomycetaceae bacterium]|nr:hypothetical protein [Planctomycetaceae bacterium]